ncbi:ribonuclease VapC [Mesorhizobium sp. L-8-10]|uniref:type II toxin-antitoxin system VapC family toxin n=1 Tax=unclassified Mesorhizobium TaxID=325217 RepID=UPI001927CBF5|nr:MULTISPECIES: type II toxin-antitoxin system VapC family toxin [unclassified Mesorhizobium]BCH27980.1 ribonuclease VapC [Mesorhizobium sp. L-8-3]BCH35852.1 ribonuclease VapC [Mesorhizobium sp. L-8-10]
MIVDASALLAVLLEEPEKDTFRDRMLLAEALSMSPINYLEASVRADDQRHPAKGAELDNLMGEFGIRIATVTAEQAHLAREAYQRFGKGNHPAKLNLGDCFAYALSKARGESLLFKGNDFGLTDVEAAL